MLSKVLNDQPGSLDAENELRLLLGLAGIGVAMVPVYASCGIAHVAGDCGGKDVVQVVVIAEDEVVMRTQERSARMPPRRWADYPPEALAEALHNRRPMSDSERGRAIHATLFLPSACISA
jgi:hypothetical protein